MGEEQIIQILWDGPSSLRDIQALIGAHDKGLYQVYTYHPLYGDCLVYIGMTRTSFAQRIAEHDYEAGSDSDRRRIACYVGRLIGKETPDPEEWFRQIDLAEMLLIHAHGPAYNSTHIQAMYRPHDVANVRVLNWGSCRSLQREVSGRMWSAPRDPGLVPYGSSAV